MYILKTHSKTKSFNTSADRDAFLRGHRDQSGYSSFVDVTPHFLSDTLSSKTIMRVLSESIFKPDPLQQNNEGHVCAILSGLKVDSLFDNIERDVYDAEYRSMSPEDPGPGLEDFKLNFAVDFCTLHIREFGSESEKQAYLDGINFGTKHDIDEMSWEAVNESDPAESLGM